jgi:hypothetical protein
MLRRYPETSVSPSHCNCYCAWPGEIRGAVSEQSRSHSGIPVSLPLEITASHLKSSLDLRSGELISHVFFFSGSAERSGAFAPRSRSVFWTSKRKVATRVLPLDRTKGILQQAKGFNPVLLLVKRRCNSTHAVRAGLASFREPEAYRCFRR